MLRSNEIRQNLLGVLEIALFMRGGAKRFAADKRTMMKSFIVPLILLPLSIWTMLAAHPESLNPTSMKILAAIYALRLFVYLGAFLAFVYMMAKSLDKLDDFFRFVTINNWLTIPGVIMMAPFVMMFMNGHYEWAEVYPLLVMITLYSYAYTAFMATRVMRIPVEFACFIAIAGMAIHQTSLDVIKWAAVNVIQLIA